MAHSRIFEISFKQLDREDYLTSNELEHEQYNDFADYVSDDLRNENGDIERFSTVMSSIFDCNGRQLTLRDISGFVEEWKADVRKKANEFDPKNNLFSFSNLRNSLNKTHKGINFYFYNVGYGLMDASQLIEDILLSHKPGDRFYIGGIIDYKY